MAPADSLDNEWFLGACNVLGRAELRKDGVTIGSPGEGGSGC